MSNVNIRRAVENIRGQTNAYTPLIETIVNAIQAIEASGRSDGRVTIKALRAPQFELDKERPAIQGFEVVDNGVGFTSEHRKSFDTLYSETKIKEGGKGFGRFICLKYFEEVRIDSVFLENSSYRRRTFEMGRDYDIIVNEKVADIEATASGTIVRLLSLKQGKDFEKKLATVAKNLIERLLPFFITANYKCPEVVIEEEDGQEAIVLNDFVNNELSAQILEIPVTDNKFTLKDLLDEHVFMVRVFKVYYPKHQKSRVSMVAHKREVSGIAIHSYIPEFEEEFFDSAVSPNGERGRNYIIKAYVFSNYLDEHVSLERGGFDFPKDTDTASTISEDQIASRAADVARRGVGQEIVSRQERKRLRVIEYVDTEAPWLKSVLVSSDLANLGYNASPPEIDTYLNRQRFDVEAKIKRDVGVILQENNVGNLKDNVSQIVTRISETSKNELIHYIALRRNILELFKKSLEATDGKYSAEGVVHDIIFPRRSDTETTTFEDHNLWIVDERLNFTSYLSSDIALDQSNNPDRPDLIAYDQRVVFRGDNEASNPVTIFEFKKPQRDDFANRSSSDDPVRQIVRYVNGIREGKYKTPEGRPIQVATNTPFYGYIVCDVNKKVREWLELENEFQPLPDAQGWFSRRPNINLYMEVLTWDKVLKDANMRNRIFFHKLGI